MPRQEINIGVAPTGAGGDTTRSGAVKINAMTQELYARTNLLGSAANLDASALVLKNPSGVSTPVAPGASGYDSPGNGQGGGFYQVGEGPSSSGVSYAGMIRIPYNATYEAQLYFPMGFSSNRMLFRCALGNAGTFGAAQEVYHTGNTTRGSGGALSAASPIVRIANVSQSERRDLQEQSFEPAGEWGVANDEARGITVERISLGEYKLSGSLGLALEGWRTHDPSSPDGGRMLGLTESHQDEDGTVIVRLFKQRWTLTEDGEMVPGRGAPIDVPLNSWIDVRLEMPRVDMQPPTTTAEK